MSMIFVLRIYEWGLF